MTIPGILEEKLSAALKAVLGEELPADFCASVTPSADLRFGDYQSNAAMVLAKRCRTNPRALAQQVVDRMGQDGVCSLEIAGPGFINFRIKPEFYAARLLAMLADDRLGVEKVQDPKTIVIDFSAPNVAKPMHVGHIRSTIIGDALSRVARFVGHNVITDNHIGDWGTQFGMILWGWKNILDEQALAANPIDELLRVYKDVNLMCKEKPELLDTCKAELVKLQAGDGENLAIWKRCVEVSKSGLSKIYGQLDIHFDYWLGESFYNDALAPLVDGMIAAGMARESDGAICVFSDGSVPPNEDPFLVQDKGEWRANPCIIRKADGGFLYATTDLATLDHRIRTWGADSIWYVVGAPQALHFRQIFSTQRRRGMDGDYRHIAFGSILGDDRKPFKTRSGDTVSLQDVLDEAIERAARVVEEKSPDMPEEEKKRVAEVVGIGAVKFAELSQNRMTDYVFNWDKMLALQGDTAPYLQNSYVRVRSIFRKLDGSPLDWKRCVEVSKSGLSKIYGQLDIHFDYWLGESFYNDALAPLVDGMIAAGMARESDGAICVFSDGSVPPNEDPFLVQDKGEWRANPCIIRKADGGFLYATTDLATLDHRIRTWGADSIWYVVGAPQALHFRQIFSTQRRRGMDGDYRHIAFGSILGDDRKPFKTRSGDTVSLQDVLDEAIERAARVVEEKSPDMPEEEKKRVAEVVGIGAVKFAELSQNRMTDYVFNWDKMLALQGDTAPYLQNSYVRVRSIFRKLDGSPLDWSAPIQLSEDAEMHLARLLARYGEVVPQVLDDCRPNVLAAYLFDLARAFHSFYEACPVLKSEGAVRHSRLALCELTARTLKHGLGLLGIQLPDRM